LTTVTHMSFGVVDAQKKKLSPGSVTTAPGPPIVNPPAVNGAAELICWADELPIRHETIVAA
jgi:hypothetical protein